MDTEKKGTAMVGNSQPRQPSWLFSGCGRHHTGRYKPPILVVHLSTVTSQPPRCLSGSIFSKGLIRPPPLQAQASSGQVHPSQTCCGKKTVCPGRKRLGRIRLSKKERRRPRPLAPPPPQLSRTRAKERGEARSALALSIIAALSRPPPSCCLLFADRAVITAPSIRVCGQVVGNELFGWVM